MKHRQGLAEPLIASYMPGKKVSGNWEAADCARRSCLAAIKANPDANATVIGVHVPTKKEDSALKQILEALGRVGGQRLFVNPSCGERKAAAKLGFMGKALGFRDYVQELGTDREAT